MAPMAMLSTAAYTREMACDGASRWGMVSSPRFTHGSATPITTSAAIAVMGEGKRASAMIGTDQPRTPTTMSWASLPRATLLRIITPPTIVPTPIAPWSQPTLAASPKSRTAITTRNTARAPQMTVWAAVSRETVRRSRSLPR